MLDDKIAETIKSDKWSDSDRDLLLNYLATNSTQQFLVDNKQHFTNELNKGAIMNSSILWAPINWVVNITNTIFSSVFNLFSLYLELNRLNPYLNNDCIDSDTYYLTVSQPTAGFLDQLATNITQSRCATARLMTHFFHPCRIYLRCRSLFQP